jgi:hypothetical protein
MHCNNYGLFDQFVGAAGVNIAGIIEAERSRSA